MEVGPQTGLLFPVSLLTEVPTVGASEEEGEQDTDVIISEQLEVYKKADTKTLNPVNAPWSCVQETFSNRNPYEWWTK